MRDLLEAAVRWNVVVTAVAVSLGYATYRIFGVEVNPAVLLVLGAGAFLVYGLDRRMPFSPEDQLGLQQCKGVPVWTLVVDGVITLWAYLALSTSAKILVFGLGALSVTYMMPVLPGCRRLKDIPFVKSTFVAMGWTSACVFIPLLDGSGALLGRKVYLLATYRALFLLPNAILADWPDRIADRQAGIRTLANSVSKLCLRNTCIWIIVFQIVICVFIVLACDFSRWTLLENLAPVCLLWIIRRPLPQARLFYGTVLDGFMAWPGILALAIVGQ